MARESITLGGGCFWCIEAVFKRLDGVLACTSGYTGGTTKNPTYQEVCTGRTGHAEVVRVEFDADVISLEQIVHRFFEAHDPTTLDRQGADVGTQYRSAIFYSSDDQRVTAERVVAAVRPSLSAPIVTRIEQLGEFYPAEEYHHDYFDRNPTAGYCRLVIAPKLKKLGV